MTSLFLPTHRGWHLFLPLSLPRQSYSLYIFNSTYVLATSRSTCLDQTPCWAPDFNVQLVPAYLHESPLSISNSRPLTLNFYPVSHPQSCSFSSILMNASETTLWLCLYPRPDPGGQSCIFIFLHNICKLQFQSWIKSGQIFSLTCLLPLPSLVLTAIAFSQVIAIFKTITGAITLGFQFFLFS